MASILKVDKIVDSGSNVLATSSGSGYAGIPAAGITGTLGSGVTFPAGHQIGFSSYTTRVLASATYNIWSVGNGGRDLTGGSVGDTRITITVKQANSKILIAHHTGACKKDSSGEGMAYIKRTIGGTTTFLDGTADGEFGHFGIDRTSAGELQRGVTFQTIDTHGQPVGTEITYFVRIYSSSVHSFYYVTHYLTATIASGYAMEIAG
jgi:hypothetical protein